MKKINDILADLHRYDPSDFLPLHTCGKPIGFVHRKNLGAVENLDRRIQVDKDVINVNLPDEGSNTLTSFFKEINDQLVAKGVLEVRHRNELAPVILEEIGAPFFHMYRYAFPFWGLRLFAVHLNGWVEKEGETYLWTAQRSLQAKIHPGALDHLVCGALMSGISVAENLYKEAEEEAGMPRELITQAKSVGLVSCTLAEKDYLKRFTPLMYDLELPQDFQPINQDGALSGFSLLPVRRFLEEPELLKKFKTTCRLVIASFLIRHGFLTPDDPHYLSIHRHLRDH